MCLWSWHWRRGSLLLSLPSIQWKQKTVSAGDKDIWSNTSAKGVLPQSVTLLLTPSSFSMFTTRPDASARRYWRQRFSVFSSMDDDCKPTIQEQSRKFVKTKNIFSSAWSSLVWILLNSREKTAVCDHSVSVTSVSESWHSARWGRSTINNNNNK